MINEYGIRLAALNRRMEENGLDGFLISDPDNIFYFAGSENFIGMDFGRPSILFIARDEQPILIVPAGDLGMVQSMAKSVSVEGWRDSAEGEWKNLLRQRLGSRRFRRVGFEAQYNPLVYAHFAGLCDAEQVIADELIQNIRLIKSQSEIHDLRKAGKVADTMMAAIGNALRVGIAEYEVSLAAIEAGTRAAAALLAEEGAHPLHSPMVNYLQIMKSGTNTDLGHCRPSLKRIVAGEPVAVCLCGMISYKHMKLAMDRPFFVESVNPEFAAMTRIALESQEAALAVLEPGIPVARVHEAASSVLRRYNYAPCTRTGRGLGVSFAEKPQIMTGDTTVLQPGMVLAIDGNLTIKHFGVQFGDSVVITEDGFEFLTTYSRELQVL
jgi:Xaa-Pro aminopeptidase